jgi:hypothetical protein
VRTPALTWQGNFDERRHDNDDTAADFASRWVTAMLTTVVGSTAKSNDGAAESLGDLDRQSGDGDFGTNLTSAFTRVRAELESTSPATYTQWLTAVSRGFLGTGGTSGPLFGNVLPRPGPLQHRLDADADRASEGPAERLGDRAALRQG